MTDRIIADISDYIFVEDIPCEADVIFLPGGSHPEQPEYAAELYKKGQSYYSVGNEAEVILQRGTRFRITKLEKQGSTFVVHMEVIEQPDYFKFGDEDTFNSGKTRHKK